MVCSVVVIEPAPRYPVTMAMDQTPLVTLQLLKVVLRNCSDIYDKGQVVELLATSSELVSKQMLGPECI